MVKGLLEVGSSQVCFPELCVSYDYQKLGLLMHRVKILAYGKLLYAGLDR